MFTLIVLMTAVSNVNAINTTEVRGTVTDLGAPEFTWTNASFPGFYYDLDKNLGAEQLTFRLFNVNPASATLSDQIAADANNQRGITYSTHAQPKNFKFKALGPV